MVFLQCHFSWQAQGFAFTPDHGILDVLCIPELYKAYKIIGLKTFGVKRCWCKNCLQTWCIDIKYYSFPGVRGFCGKGMWYKKLWCKRFLMYVDNLLCSK